MNQHQIEHDVAAVWSVLHAPLLRFVQRRVPDAATAEDIVQDVFVTVTTQIHTLRTSAAINGWVYQIARSAIADYYRSQRVLDALPLSLAAPEPPNECLREVVGRCVHRLLGALPPRSREALLLTDIEGLTQRELAERLGLSCSGAKARVQRARARLKALLLACCNVQLDQRGSPVSCRPRDPQSCASSCCDELCCAG